MKKLLSLLILLCSTNLYAAQNIGDIKLTLNPSVQPSVVFDTPIDFDDESYNAWMKGLEAVRTKGLKEVTFRISGVGGSLYYESQIARKIRQLQSEGIEVKMIVDGRAVSGNALIVCFADSYVMNENSQLYFHAGAVTTASFFGTILDRNISITTSAPYDNLDMVFNYDTCISSGILTKNDVNVIKSGKAIVIEQKNGQRIKYVSDFDNQYISSLNTSNVLNLISITTFGLLILIIIVLIIKRVK